MSSRLWRLGASDLTMLNGDVSSRRTSSKRNPAHRRGNTSASQSHACAPQCTPSLTCDQCRGSRAHAPLERNSSRIRNAVLVTRAGVFHMREPNATDPNETPIRPSKRRCVGEGSRDPAVMGRSLHTESDRVGRGRCGLVCARWTDLRGPPNRCSWIDCRPFLGGSASRSKVGGFSTRK